MKRSRRTFSAEFKAKVALEAIKEQLTMSELAQKHSIHPNQITDWKKQFLSNASLVFKSGVDDTAAQAEKESEKLYKKIGQLQIEVDFLKKSLGES
jgi:transposase